VIRRRSPEQQAAGPRRRGPLPVTLRGHRHSIVLAVWVAVTILALGLFVVSIPVAYVHFHTVCKDSACDYWSLSLAERRSLEELNFSFGFYAAYNVTLEVVHTLGFWAAGAFIFWRKSDEWMPLLLSLALVLFGIDTLDVLSEEYQVLSLPVAFVQCLGAICFFISFYLFPDGRFMPRWTRVPASIWIAFLVPLYFFPDSPFSATTWPPLPVASLMLALLGTLVFAQIYRYVKVSDPIERQQTKWVVFGLTAAIVLYIGVGLAGLIFLHTESADQGVLYFLISRFSFFLADLLIPLSIGVAILHYRLWDIDVVINRTLVYGSLTATLALVYFGGVTVTQAIFPALTGQDDPQQLTIVVSTLIIAALFTPLRRRIQGSIDRRFYRKKYDARKTLEAFSAKLRNDTDLDALSDDLLGVVKGTMEPAHVSLWMHPDPAAQKNKKWAAHRESGRDEE
jgi:hypothetical protein